MEQKFSVGDKVLVNSGILYRDTEGSAQNVKLVDEGGTIKKVDSCCTYYVKTQFGVHYLHQSKLTAEAEPV